MLGSNNWDGFIFCNRDSKTELWWSADPEAHGDSTWKVMAQQGTDLVHKHDADVYGDFMSGKHKGPTGKVMPMKNMACRKA